MSLPIHPGQPGPPEPGSTDEDAVVDHVLDLLEGAVQWVELLDLPTAAVHLLITDAAIALREITNRSHDS